WDPYTNRTTAATYAVYDGTQLLGTVVLDQTQAPSADPTHSLSDAGRSWRVLGGPYTIQSGTVVVKLTGATGPNRYAIADAIRITDALPPAATIAVVTPTTRSAAAGSIPITFNKPVYGLNLADLSLTRDGSGDLLTPAQTLTTVDNVHWTL